MLKSLGSTALYIFALIRCCILLYIFSPIGSKPRSRHPRDRPMLIYESTKSKWLDFRCSRYHLGNTFIYALAPTMALSYEDLTAVNHRYRVAEQFPPIRYKSISTAVNSVAKNFAFSSRTLFARYLRASFIYFISCALSKILLKLRRRAPHKRVIFLASALETGLFCTMYFAKFP